MSRLTRSLLFVLMMVAVPVVSHAGIILSIGIAPPPLPVYDQPLCPAEGYIWTPGYWAYSSDDGYFWVPGTWVMVPEPGLLWTPGYWGWSNGLFVFNEGYWGPQVGFYGGVNYGFGYIGSGYAGGYWNNGAFFYNRSVNNVGSVTNVYNKTVIVNNITVNHVSYNGGEGGITARPTSQEEAAAHARHIPPTSAQTSHVQAASTNRQLFESQNHGKPAIAATAKPGQFSGGVVAAKAAAPSYKPPEARNAGRTTGAQPGNQPAGGSRPNTAVHPNDVTPTRPAAPNTGKPQVDQKYQKQQNALNAKQDQERQNLQKTQEAEHQRLAQQKANEPAKQQVEQKHQQQTQQLQQKHTVEQQKLQQKQAPPASRTPEAKPKEKEKN
jgi:WXXGXW repeat (2 copies)